MKLKIMGMVLNLVMIGVSSEIHFRKTPNSRNWKRGIIDQCDDFSMYDNEFIDEGEGFSLEGFVPKSSETLINEKIGVFISIGLDLGSKDFKFLQGLFDANDPKKDAIIQKLSPFLGLKGEQAIKKLDEIKLVLLPEEELILANALKLRIFSQIGIFYDKFKNSNSINFAKLSLLVKSVLMSFFLQHGSIGKRDFKENTKLAELKFLMIESILRNDWKKFTIDLKRFGLISQFRANRKKEVDLIESLTEKCDRNLEVFFAVDQSGSIGSKDFLLAKSTITEFVSNMPDNESHFGVLFYNDSPKICVDYDVLNDKKKVIDLVDKWVYQEGGTRTDLAILESMKIVQPKRKTLNPQLYVLTDGSSNKPIDEAAKKAREEKLILNAVGIGKMDKIQEDELKRMAYDLNHVSIFKDYKEMKCNVRQLVNNICYQSDLKESEQEIKVNFQEKRVIVFGIKVKKTENLKVSIKQSGRDECLIYGAINVEYPDALVSDYFHSGNSDEKTIVFSYPEKSISKNLQKLNFEAKNHFFSQINLKNENVNSFIAEISDAITENYRIADNSFVFESSNQTPDIDKEFYYAFVSIESKIPKELVISINNCKKGEVGCDSGTNDETRKINKLWFIIPIIVLVIIALFFICRKSSRETNLPENEYTHI